jgi:hypothetical protein
VAYATVTQWKANPGRAAELLEGARAAAKVHQRLGGRVRMFQSQLSGQQAGILNFMVEFDDMASLATWWEQLAVDTEYVAVLNKYINVPNPVGTMLSNSLFREVPVEHAR